MLRRLEKKLESAKHRRAALSDPNASRSADVQALVLSTSTGDRGREPGYDDQSDTNDESTLLSTPAMLISKEHRRQGFDVSSAFSATPDYLPPFKYVPDPVSAGILDEATAVAIYNLLITRANQFICLLDPGLHSYFYVRSRSPFLLTVLLMASSKFFKPDIFPPCQRLTKELVVRALSEDWKSIEVIQAFACLSYWGEDENDVSRNQKLQRARD